MRIADKMQFTQVQGNIQKNRREMSDLQNQAATQKRITKPSDDPLAAARVLGNRTEERGNAQFVKNINQLKSFLEFTDQSLGELGEIFMRAKELAVGQASDAGASAQTRLITASEVEQIYNQAVQIGNRKLGERFIFSGYKTQTQPFSQNGEYFGDDGDMRIQTHKESFVAMNIPGSKVFLGRGLSADGITRPSIDAPRNVDELNELRDQEQLMEEQQQEKDYNSLHTRGPAALGRPASIGDRDPVDQDGGINILKVLKGVEIAMRTNDKAAIQDSLDTLDQALNQVILARAEVGSRIMAVNNTTDTLQKAIVDNKTSASQLEDADVFQVVSDINKTDATLRATLETSGKLIGPTLLDFLK
ncbi:MAG: flagellar hook-associated protein FlgL [Bdellovibrionaceae bacterium]|nr:flagellar hook-associated protein FlgL [Pseudobdellovibrionaceae bacterium]MBX3032791.1 flagellar hook-associated protein FlgL [Pseudobdellovibrionaceae bacterium]